MHQILTFNFLQVVWQCISGVVGYVTYCLVGNLTDFPAVKEFWHIFWGQCIYENADTSV